MKPVKCIVIKWTFNRGNTSTKVFHTLARIGLATDKKSTDDHENIDNTLISSLDASEKKEDCSVFDQTQTDITLKTDLSLKSLAFIHYNITRWIPKVARSFSSTRLFHGISVTLCVKM